MRTWYYHHLDVFVIPSHFSGLQGASHTSKMHICGIMYKPELEEAEKRLPSSQLLAFPSSTTLRGTTHNQHDPFQPHQEIVLVTPQIAPMYAEK